MLSRAALVVALLILSVSAAGAQPGGDSASASSAADAQRPAQAGTTTSTPATPDDDGYVERSRRWAKNAKIFERLSGTTDGWYPRLGGMTRGSGFALGPGYRTHVFGDRVLLDLSTAISTKAYKATDAKARWLQAFDKRLELWTDLRYEVFPQEDFFGIGNDSSLARQTSYARETFYASARASFAVLPWLRLGGVSGYARPRVGHGTDRAFPSIEELFTDADAPGLVGEPDFLHATIFAELDGRDVPGRPRSGGFTRVAYGTWNDRTLDRYDFRRFDVDTIGFVPLDANKSHVLSGRIGVSYVNNAPGHRIPFYYLAYVGGVDTLRSYREYRFQDENAMWMSAEYLWATPIQFATVAAFVDAGQVRSNWQDLGLGGLRHGYGAGLRFHSDKQTFARFDVGTGGGEGWRMFLQLAPTF